MCPLPKPSAVLFCSDVATLSQFYQAVDAMQLIASDATPTVLEVEGFSS